MRLRSPLRWLPALTFFLGVRLPNAVLPFRPVPMLRSRAASVVSGRTNAARQSAVEDGRSVAYGGRRDGGGAEDRSELFRSQYEEIVSHVVDQKRVRRDIDPTQKTSVVRFLLDTQTPDDLPSAAAGRHTSASFQKLMRERKARFLQTHRFSLEQYQFATRSLIYLGDHCAKRQVPLASAIAWRKIMHMGFVPHEKSISTYMYVAGMDPCLAETLVDVASLHDVCYEPSEKTVTLRIKTLLARSQVEEAENVLAALPDKGEADQWRKLRTYTPFVEHYCSVNDCASLLRTFRSMRNSAGVIFDAETYAAILSTLAVNGKFHSGAEPIEGVEQYGFAPSGSPLLDQIMAEMATDILEVPERVATQLAEAFAQVSPDVSVENLVRPTRADRNNSTTVDITATTLVHRVEIDTNTAKCQLTNAKLRLFALDDIQRQHVHDTLLEMASIQHRVYVKTLKYDSVTDEDLGLKELSNFSSWLDTREGEPFTAIVDGANVAYFGHPDLHYSQIKLAVDQLESMGERPLVVMPAKYMSRKFRLSRFRNHQVLSDKDVEVMEELKDKMYKVPHHCLDDYYWMLASVSNQTVARAMADMSVSVGDDSRFPGLRPILITNDRMRDHKLDLLDPREFRRWCSCHIVNYNISAYDGDEWSHRVMEFQPADCFSREIQGNEHRNNGLVWHIPVTEWEDNERLCISVSQT